MKHALAAIAVAAALAACSSREPEPEPVEPEETTEMPEQIPSEALTSQGWRDARIGMTLNEVVAALGPDAEPEAIGGPEPEYCDMFRPETAPEGLLVMIEEGVLTRISLYENTEVKTAEGLGIGDDADDVRAAYGDRVIARGHTYLEPPAEYLTVWEEGVETDGPYVDDPEARGIRYVTDESGRIEAIHAGGTSIQYVEGCL